MGMYQARVADPALCEEIAVLARKYLEDPRCDGIREIDRLISGAVSESRWDDVSKWHRVRLRYLRFKQQNHVAAKMLSPRSAA
jgi:hypothetical protein